MSSKILITGVAGFIGSNMCDFLLKKNYEIVGVDNLITGSNKNLDKFKSNERFTFIKHNICEPLRMNLRVDKILHFASPASPSDYLKYPIETLRVNSIGTENILKLAVINKASVLVASTSEIYGDPKEHPQEESYFGNVNPIGPRGAYDEGKRYLEALTMAYHRKENINTKIVRIFNTYGPNMRNNDGRAIPNFINQILKNKSVTIYGDGTQTRSFCYVSDTINGIYKLLNSNYNSPVNIGNPKEFSINEIVDIIFKLIPSKSKKKYLKLPENDPKLRRPNIQLANDILNWTPKINLENGLKKTIDYFCNNK